jgi:hypothetical protein
VTDSNAPLPPGGGVFVSRDPVLVFVLNLLVGGGCGYLILGQKAKGIAAIALWVLGIFGCFWPSALVALFAAVDGYLQAQTLQQGRPIGAWTFFRQSGR